MSVCVFRHPCVLIKRPLFKKHGRIHFVKRSYCIHGDHSLSFKNFEDMISFRRLQAQRSALIGLSRETSLEDSLKICERFGTISKKIAFIPNDIAKHQLACIVEYESVEGLRSLLDSCQYQSGKGSIPVFSRILCHNSTGGNKKTLKALCADGSVEYRPGTYEAEVQSKLKTCKNVPEQVEVFYEHVRLSDLGSRLRFLFCVQVEDSLHGLLPDCRVFPFGSSVNGFGRHNCDLDVSLHITPTKVRSDGLTFQPPSRQIVDDRTRTQMTLEVLGDLIQSFYPCVMNVRKILRARVPILKMHHTLFGIDCDISASNGTGFIMSEILYLMGELDPRVRPLVFAVRQWAHSMYLTRETSPGPWITNFSLTLLVLFFLQTRQPSVLPALQTLKDLAGPEDVQTVDGIDCTFKRRFLDIPKATNTEDLYSLLSNFFLFCTKMNWKADAISLVSGNVLEKPDNSAMYIENPLENSLNVARNVTPPEVDKLVSCALESCYQMETGGADQVLMFFGMRVSAHQKKHKGLVVSQLFEKLSLRSKNVEIPAEPSIIKTTQQPPQVRKAEVVKSALPSPPSPRRKLPHRKSNNIVKVGDVWKII